MKKLREILRGLEKELGLDLEEDFVAGKRGNWGGLACPFWSMWREFSSKN